MAAPKKYPDELRARAVCMYRTSTLRPTFRQLAEQLGVHRSRGSWPERRRDRRRPVRTNEGRTGLEDGAPFGES